MRDVRMESEARSRHLVTDYSDSLRSTMADTAQGWKAAQLHINALSSEHAIVMEKGHEEMRKYANYLCSMRTLLVESDNFKRAKEEIRNKGDSK